jgi:hypothetical protein
VNSPMRRLRMQACVISPAELVVPSALVALMATGSGVNRRLYFSTVFLSMADEVAPESNSIRTWCHEGGVLSSETVPEIYNAVGASDREGERLEGRLGRSLAFRGLNLLLVQQGRLVYSRWTWCPTEQ